MGGDSLILAVLAAVIAAGAAVAVTLALARRGGGADAAEALVARVAASQAELAGRLDQISAVSAATQAELRQALDQRLDAVTKRVSDTLTEQGKNHQTVLEGLRERLAVIDRAQSNIAELSGQVVGLQEVLSNKQARGAFGEVQLENLVRAALPPSAYAFQAPVGDGRRADCLLTLPNPPGAIAVDAKFPLESYHALRAAEDEAQKTAAKRAFRDAILKHVDDIAARYIVPGETAESALMFLPSEAIYAELHANFPDVVQRSYRKRVWVVSPTTLMATLNTVRAVLKDARMREQAGVIQKEVVTLLEDVDRLDDRVAKLEKHFTQTTEDVRQIRISTGKITSRGERIVEVELGEDGAEAADDGAALAADTPAPLAPPRSDAAE